MHGGAGRGEQPPRPDGGHRDHRAAEVRGPQEEGLRVCTARRGENNNNNREDNNTTIIKTIRVNIAQNYSFRVSISGPMPIIGTSD